MEFCMKRVIFAVPVVLGLAISSLAQASAWDFDTSHTYVSFAVRHMMVSDVRGVIGGAKGTLTLDDADIQKSTLEVSFDPATIDTRDAKRDGHLKSPDFFDVAKFPTVTFKSKSIKKNGKDKLKVIGDLTIRGVTKEVTLDVANVSGEMKDPYGNTKRGATATTKFNRKDFGMSWNVNLDKGGVLVGEDVNLTIEIEVNKKA